MKKAEIHTQKGIMKIEFYKQDAPKTVQNFIETTPAYKRDQRWP